MRTAAVRLTVLLAPLAVAASVGAQSRLYDTYVLFGSERVLLGSIAVVEGGDVGSNGKLTVGARASIDAGSDVAADSVRIGSLAAVPGDVFYNQLYSVDPFTGTLHPGLTLPLLPPLDFPPLGGGGADFTVPRRATRSLAPGLYDRVVVEAGGTLQLDGGDYQIDTMIMRGGSSMPSALQCAALSGCTLHIRTRLLLGGGTIGFGGGRLAFLVSGTKTVVVGRSDANVRAMVVAPLAIVKLRSSFVGRSDFTGQLVGREVRIGVGARIRLGTLTPAECGNNVAEPPAEECDGTDSAACPAGCQPDCHCVPGTGTPATLHAVGPSVIHNATSFGLQLFGEDFLPGAQLRLLDKATSALVATLPTTWISSTEMTALVPAGLPVPSGIERELTARVVNPGSTPSTAPDIGHCTTDRPNSPIACTADTDCPPGAGTCLKGGQRLTLFNDAVFLNPNSAAVVPPPAGVCDNGTPCQGAAACTGIGSGACSPKLYVTPQQRDELWVYNTGTGQFVDRNAGQPGIQGIPVGDNPFHVEMLTAGGPARAWVVNRFDDSFSIVDPATDTEVARVTGAALGIPGRLRMETEIEFNRAGTRAYLSNENVDAVDVLDIAGANRDAPVRVGAIDVGLNPRGMATNAADTRLYVANIQSADVSVVDIAPGSPTENQVVATVAARATDDIVGGRAEGWEPFVIGGRAPRGIVFSDAMNAVFVTSIGPQTGPRQGVVLTGGAIINPTVTVIDAASDTVVAHVALEGMNANRPSCTDPELMALDDVRGRLYVTCQGSGTIDVLDTADLMAGVPAESAIVSLPPPSDVPVPTLTLPPTVGAFGAKVCAAFTASRGAACTTNADCAGCPALVEGLPVTCCAVNNPVGVHNGPRGIALSGDGATLHVVNQFTTSVATVDVSPADPTASAVTRTTSFPGAFGSDSLQRDRRLGQIEFFTDVKKSMISCATCHIDDHQDGVFFEADVRGPRLRRVLSVRGTRDFPPLLQDQLVPDLVAFTDIVVHAERGGPLPCIPCVELGGGPFCFGSGGSECTLTSDPESFANAAYAKAITFFPNPNLDADGALSTSVPLPGGLTGDARRGGELFDQLACQTCHPEPLFTVDQFRSLETTTLGQPVRMRDVATPVLIPLRAQCQDNQRPTGFDGSSGFSVPTLRGIWDTFPLLMSGAAGLGAVGPEPGFAGGCTPGSAGCCAQLQSPLNPGGIPVPEQHLAVTTKDPLRALLTPPLAVPGSGHGSALALSPDDLNALIAYLRSL